MNQLRNMLASNPQEKVAVIKNVLENGTTDDMAKEIESLFPSFSKIKRSTMVPIKITPSDINDDSVMEFEDVIVENDDDDDDDSDDGIVDNRAYLPPRTPNPIRKPQTMHAPRPPPVIPKSSSIPPPPPPPKPIPPPKPQTKKQIPPPQPHTNVLSEVAKAIHNHVLHSKPKPPTGRTSDVIVFDDMTREIVPKKVYLATPPFDFLNDDGKSISDKCWANFITVCKLHPALHDRQDLFTSFEEEEMKSIVLRNVPPNEFSSFTAAQLRAFGECSTTEKLRGPEQEHTKHIPTILSDVSTFNNMVMTSIPIMYYNTQNVSVGLSKKCQQITKHTSRDTNLVAQQKEFFSKRNQIDNISSLRARISGQNFPIYKNPLATPNVANNLTDKRPKKQHQQPKEIGQIGQNSQNSQNGQNDQFDQIGQNDQMIIGKFIFFLNIYSPTNLPFSFFFFINKPNKTKNQPKKAQKPEKPQIPQSEMNSSDKKNIIEQVMAQCAEVNKNNASIAALMQTTMMLISAEPTVESNTNNNHKRPAQANESKSTNNSNSNTNNNKKVKKDEEDEVDECDEDDVECNAFDGMSEEDSRGALDEIIQIVNELYDEQYALKIDNATVASTVVTLVDKVRIQFPREVRKLPDFKEETLKGVSSAKKILMFWNAWFSFAVAYDGVTHSLSAYKKAERAFADNKWKFDPAAYVTGSKLKKFMDWRTRHGANIKLLGEAVALYQSEGRDAFITSTFCKHLLEFTAWVRLSRYCIDNKIAPPPKSKPVAPVAADKEDGEDEEEVEKVQEKQVKPQSKFQLPSTKKPTTTTTTTAPPTSSNVAKQAAYPPPSHRPATKTPQIVISQDDDDEEHEDDQADENQEDQDQDDDN